jgi:hypothetical protein
VRLVAAARCRRKQRQPTVWWRHRATQVRGFVSRIALLLLDVDLAYLTLLFFLKAAPISSTSSRAVALGLFGRRPVLPAGAAASFFLM